MEILFNYIGFEMQLNEIGTN